MSSFHLLLYGNLDSVLMLESEAQIVIDTRMHRRSSIFQRGLSRCGPYTLGACWSLRLLRSNASLFTLRWPVHRHAHAPALLACINAAAIVAPRAKAMNDVPPTDLYHSQASSFFPVYVRAAYISISP
jgi:hypothetical protein